MVRDPERNLLTLSFLDRDPRAAARVLESIDAGDAAAFFNRAPARIIAPVVATMIPWSAARCLAGMNAEKASALLRSMGYADAVSILRLVKTEKREQLLEYSTKRFARSFRNSLTYPSDTVGAWTDVEVPALQESVRVSDAIRALKRFPSVGSHMFVINSDKEFAGVVPVAEILRHDETTILKNLADRSVKPLSNRDSLRSCAARADWDQMTLLPVVGRKRNFLGALSRASLSQALNTRGPDNMVVRSGSVPMQLLTVILVVGLAFADLMVSQADGVESIGKGRKSGGRQREKGN